MQELSDYFDSNPATPVKDIGAPIEDTQIVTVAMNLSDMFETVDIVEDTNRENIVPSSCSLVNSEKNSVEGEANNNNLLSRGNGSPEPTLSTNIGVEENQSKQLGEGDTEGQDPEKDNSGGQSEYEEESINDETSNKSTKIQSEKNLRRRSETVGEFIFPTI